MGKVHRVPPVRLKCVSEKRMEEMSGQAGGRAGLAVAIRCGILPVVAEM
jgi:hypothetical protein